MLITHQQADLGDRALWLETERRHLYRVRTVRRGYRRPQGESFYLKLEPFSLSTQQFVFLPWNDPSLRNLLWEREMPR